MSSVHLLTLLGYFVSGLCLWNLHMAWTRQEIRSKGLRKRETEPASFWIAVALNVLSATIFFGLALFSTLIATGIIK